MHAKFAYGNKSILMFLDITLNCIKAAVCLSVCQEAIQHITLTSVKPSIIVTCLI